MGARPKHLVVERNQSCIQGLGIQPSNAMNLAVVEERSSMRLIILEDGLPHRPGFQKRQGPIPDEDLRFALTT